MDTASITRFIVLVVAVINAVLNLLGHEIISDELTNDLIALISGAWFIWAAWKNNYISKKGLKQKEVLVREGLTRE